MSLTYYLTQLLFADDSKTIETKVNVVYGILASGESHGHHDVGLCETGPENELSHNNEDDYVVCN